MRILSLLPSATELLCIIEGGERLLVGRSHECDYPPSISHLPVLTSQRTTATDGAAIDQQVREALAEHRSLYELDVEALGRLAPDVILTQDLCEVCSIDLPTVRSAAASLDPSPEIISLNPASIEDVFDDLLRIGAAVGLEAAADAAMVALRERFWSARDIVNPYIDGPTVAFLEWIDPIFIGGHWTPQLIEMAGGRHPLNPPGARSRQITAEELINSQPQRIIICPCGYSLRETERDLASLTSRPWWDELAAVRDGRVALVDGSAMFNRPGPRLVDAYEWLVSWIWDRPDRAPAAFPQRALERMNPSVRKLRRA